MFQTLWNAFREGLDIAEGTIARLISRVLVLVQCCTGRTGIGRANVRSRGAAYACALTARGPDAWRVSKK